MLTFGSVALAQTTPGIHPGTGMPGMTMVFQVKEPAMLDQIKPGDRVRFHVEKADSGMVVTTLEPAK